MIRDRNGQPVPNARVYFVDGPVPVADVAALTARDGSFSVGAPVAGTYTLECSAEDLAPAQVVVTVGGGETGRVDLSLRPA